MYYRYMLVSPSKKLVVSLSQSKTTMTPPGGGVECMTVSLVQWEYNINNVSVGGCPCSMCQCSSRVFGVGRDDRALLMTYGESNNNR